MTAATGETSDAVLARRAADGDEQAFSTLMRRYKEPIYRLLRRYTGDADEAYEAAQEAFIAAWGALARYDPDRPFGAWLRTIAINKARDRGRRMAVRRLLFSTRPLEETGAVMQRDTAQAAEDLLADREDLAALDRAIARLPTALKESLLLTAFDGLSHRDAGSILRVSAKTVETRIYRARKLLALALVSEKGEAPR